MSIRREQDSIDQRREIPTIMRRDGKKKIDGFRSMMLTQISPQSFRIVDAANVPGYPSASLPVPRSPARDLTLIGIQIKSNIPTDDNFQSHQP